MRRSLAPSQKGRVIPACSTSTCSSKDNKTEKDNDEITIQRLPMFGFLEVPEALNKQFKVPSGCVITEKTLELRKLKRLGNPNRFQVIRPGDLAKGVFRVTTNFQEQLMLGEEDADEEQLPTSNNLPPFEPLVLWTDPNDTDNKIEVIPELACRLRPHQREGVQFLFECTMGLRGFEGNGCILADDMGLGKTLMSITALWTLINQGFIKGEPAVKKVMVVCPTSLVGNWDNEIRKWVGDRCPTFAVKQEPKKIIKNFLMHRGKGVLIVSYETQRLYFKLFEEAAKKSSMMPSSNTTTSYSPVCDLIICDEAHKLKNAESELSKCLSALPAKKRILLSGTPMQNELTEFFNMVNFCNPGVLGTVNEFRRRYERPILASREPDALESEIQEAGRLQKELSVIVNEFILKRGNILNAQHLPPKLVQFVCCRLTPLQEAMYERLLSSKEIRHIREGKQTNTLNSIRQLINICSHPQLILDQYQRKLANKEDIDDDLAAMVEMIPNKGSLAFSSNTSNTATNNKSNGVLSRMEQLKSRSQLMGNARGKSSSFSTDQYIDPEQSGKMAVLFRMMQAMRAVQRGERIVVVSNYTSTLDLIETMCQQQKWPVLRLDGTVSATKRTKLVDEFNNPHSNSFAFLLSSKAGGCGINLIGGNRLVLFDPDWNPASDKQAAGRIWREGQKRRCFIYRFMSTGSIEEKIIQRQLSKEGLVDIVDDKEQVNQFSSDELRQLFTLLKDTRSDTHDTLLCPRCTFVKNKRNSGNKGTKLTGEQQAACLKFLSEIETFLLQETIAYQRREAMRLQAALSADVSNEALQKLVKKTNKVYEMLPFHDRFEALRKKLLDLEFDNLTAYSRRQREIFQEIENDLKGDLNDIYDAEDDQVQRNGPASETMDNSSEVANNVNINYNVQTTSSADMLHYFPSSFSVYGQFLRQWTDIVPNLMSLGQKKPSEEMKEGDNASGNNNSTSNGSEENSNCVEQEGCPEETDMNKWSHHCCPLSCDDELFAKALGDDEALVSFVFGLEVNWSLLEQREAETREEKENRKLQQIKDLEELNAKRRALKEKLLRGESNSSDETSDKEKEEEDGIANNDGNQANKQNTFKKQTKSNTKGKKNSSVNEKEGVSKKKRRKLEEIDVDSDVEDEVESNDLSVMGDDDISIGKEVIPAKKKSLQKTKKEKTTEDIIPNKDYNVSKKCQKSSVIIEPPINNNMEKIFIPDENSATYELDVFFDQDRKKLRKLLSKGKLHIPTFDYFWKTLKTENNDWRCMLTPDNIEIFTRIPGLKISELRKYKRNVDFFVDVRGLMNHFLLQCRLRDDDVLAELLLPLVPTTELSSVSAVNPAVVEEKQFPQPAKTRIVLSDDEDDTVHATKFKSSKRKRNLFVFDEDEEDDELNPNSIATTSATVDNKFRIDGAPSDEKPLNFPVKISNVNKTTPVKQTLPSPSVSVSIPVSTRYKVHDIISFSDDEQTPQKQQPVIKSSPNQTMTKRKRDNSHLVTDEEEADVHRLSSSASKRKVKFDFQSEDKENAMNVDEKDNVHSMVVDEKKRAHVNDSLLTTCKVSSHNNNANINNYPISLLSQSASVGPNKDVTVDVSVSQVSSSSSEVAGFSQDGAWTCDVCTFINDNPVFKKKCQICKTKRFGSQRLAKRELVELSQLQ